MKKLSVLLFLILLAGGFIFAQNQKDALRYSQNFYGGTARGLSMGGAFTALGGDFSSLSYNPAGIAVYRTTELTVTPSFLISNTETNPLPNSALTSVKGLDTEYNFNLNNLGVVASYRSDNDEEWANINFAVGYNQKNNFNRNLVIEGLNTESSLIDYYTDDSQGINPADLWAYRERLAFDAYLLDTIAGSNYQYVNALPNDFPIDLTQRKTLKSEGYMGEYVFSFGANYAHKLFIGATFGIQAVRYEETAYHYEENNTLHQDYYEFSSFTYQEHLITRGTGFNFKFGLIYKPLYWLRIGGAIHTPTFFSLEDDYMTEMTANVHYVDDFGNEPIGPGYQNHDAQPTDVDGNYIGPLLYEYDLTTPMRAMGGIAFVIKKHGLISVDYEHIDYSKARLGAVDYDFHDENSAIQEQLTSTNNIRVGGEFKAGVFSLRGGYARYGNPYSSNSLFSDVMRSAISGGVGINSGKFYIDLAYVYNMYTKTNFLYDVYSDQKVVGADIDYTNSNMYLTFGIRF